jgi:hypothetical protein
MASTAEVRTEECDGQGPRLSCRRQVCALLRILLPQEAVPCAQERMGLEVTPKRAQRGIRGWYGCVYTGVLAAV